MQKGKEFSINVDPDVSKYLAELQFGARFADPEKFQQYIREQSGQTLRRLQERDAERLSHAARDPAGSRQPYSFPRAELEKYYNENKAKYMREERCFCAKF